MLCQIVQKFQCLFVLLLWPQHHDYKSQKELKPCVHILNMMMDIKCIHTTTHPHYRSLNCTESWSSIQRYTYPFWFGWHQILQCDISQLGRYPCTDLANDKVSQWYSVLQIRANVRHRHFLLYFAIWSEGAFTELALLTDWLAGKIACISLWSWTCSSSPVMIEIKPITDLLFSQATALHLPPKLYIFFQLCHTPALKMIKKKSVKLKPDWLKMYKPNHWEPSKNSPYLKNSKCFPSYFSLYDPWPLANNPNRQEGRLKELGHSCVSAAERRLTPCNATPPSNPSSPSHPLFPLPPVSPSEFPPLFLCLWLRVLGILLEKASLASRANYASCFWHMPAWPAGTSQLNTDPVTLPS